MRTLAGAAGSPTRPVLSQCSNPTIKLCTHDLIPFWGRKILPKVQPFSGFDSERERGQWWDEDKREREEKGREMARGEWRLQLRHRGNSICSYKKVTLLVCFFNIVVALYTLRSLYGSLYIYSGSVARNIVEHRPDQIRKMEESNRIRKDYKPVELIKLVKELEGEFSREDVVVELPRHLKQKIIDEVMQRLGSLNVSSKNISYPQAMAKERGGGKVHAFSVSQEVENWREQKLEEVKLVVDRGTSNSTIPHEEAGMLVRALESDWAVVSEEIGLWIPAEVVNDEHNDKPEGESEIEEEVLPGKPLPPQCNTELHTDYGGLAVRWGLTHHKDSAADCCQACLDQAKRAKEGEKKCNIWVYCPSEFGCHSPDIYQHKYQECWLKYDEKPKLNFKDKYPEWYRNSRPSAPLVVPWASGVVSPGDKLPNPEKVT
ncbi:unnamed protein product [Sphenostylis stenocarpa]|uniref:Apple domain-containing protein n=1 Tax=Sphenostylis stenocarpa TaxID=92480 RepID=A0AA86T222_9FABA|nr:unnamed protein product [Sphenostylis stenocarpa]